jgi:hypothetical protein
MRPSVPPLEVVRQLVPFIEEKLEYMIRQQVGDLLEIEFEGNWFYLIIITKIVMLGGNIVFAFHNNGQRMDRKSLMQIRSGFNICTDLLWPKRKGWVRRIGKVPHPEDYLKTELVKGTFETRQDKKAKLWYIYHISDLRNHIARVRLLTNEQKRAMDHATYSFDLVARKIMERYTPDRDGRI